MSGEEWRARAILNNAQPVMDENGGCGQQKWAWSPKNFARRAYRQAPPFVNPGYATVSLQVAYLDSIQAMPSCIATNLAIARESKVAIPGLHDEVA